jgi:hypothetical protein
MQLGTVVGIIPVGRGHVIFSTLDITANLGAPDGPAHVARKLLGNYLAHAVALARAAQGKEQVAGAGPTRLKN